MTKLQADVDFIKEVYPVTKAISYGQGSYEFIRTAKKKSRAIRPPRSRIMSFSRKSLVRLMFTMQATQVELGSMLTLTYPKLFPSKGDVVKRDLGVVLQKIRRIGWSYVWFLEFQVRGAPHIHILLSPDVITPNMRVEFGLFWTERVVLSEWYQEVCAPEDFINESLKVARFNCHPDTFELLRKKDGAKRYATQYASKEKQKKVPKNYDAVGRFWGASRDVKPDGLEFDVTEEEVEEWLVKNGHPASAWHMVPRYIWGLGEMKVKPQDSGGDNPQPLLRSDCKSLQPVVC